MDRDDVDRTALSIEAAHAQISGAETALGRLAGAEAEALRRFIADRKLVIEALQANLKCNEACARA